MQVAHRDGLFAHIFQPAGAGAVGGTGCYGVLVSSALSHSSASGAGSLCSLYVACLGSSRPGAPDGDLVAARAAGRGGRTGYAAAQQAGVLGAERYAERLQGGKWGSVRRVGERGAGQLWMAAAKDPTQERRGSDTSSPPALGPTQMSQRLLPPTCERAVMPWA